MGPRTIANFSKEQIGQSRWAYKREGFLKRVTGLIYCELRLGRKGHSQKGKLGEACEEMGRKKKRAKKLKNLDRSVGT